MSETVRIRIEKLVPGGEGLSRLRGRVVFVPYVIPGETVQVEITENRKDFCRGGWSNCSIHPPLAGIPSVPISAVAAGAGSST